MKIGKQRILIIDDDQAIQKSIAAMLKATDVMMELGDHAERISFENHNFQRHLLDQKPTNCTNQRPDGWYRQFANKQRYQR